MRGTVLKMSTEAHVDVTDLGLNLPAWLERVRVGEQLVVLDHGTAIARIVPLVDTRDSARRTLADLRAKARVGDIESPLGETWNAIDDHT